MAAAGQRHGNPRIGAPDCEAMALELEVADDARRYPTRRVLGLVRALLEHLHLMSGAGEVMRAHQLVDAAAQDQHVRAHAPLRRIAIAALRPGAPITPPPGCVPEPHW